MGKLQIFSGFKHFHFLNKMPYSCTASYSAMVHLKRSFNSFIRNSSAPILLNKSSNCGNYCLFLPKQYERECSTSNSKTVIPKNKSRPAKKRVQKKKEAVATDQLDKEIFLAVAYSTAARYNLPMLSTAIDAQGLYKRLSLPDDVDEVLHVTAKYQVNNEPRHMYFFGEGSVVFWNIPIVEQRSVLNFLKPYEINSYDENLVAEEKEDLEYYYTENETKFLKGRILMKENEDNQLETFAFSNALAHSVKLALSEASLDSYIDSMEYLAEDMRLGKKTKLTPPELYRKRGELFALRHCINFSDLMDTPDFYWDRADLEKIYKETCNHLDVSKRVKVMNDRLTYSSEFIDLLSNHFTDKHHIGLERMIIALIMVEVVLGFAGLVKQ